MQQGESAKGYPPGVGRGVFIRGLVAFCATSCAFLCCAGAASAELSVRWSATFGGEQNREAVSSILRDPSSGEILATSLTYVNAPDFGPTGGLQFERPLLNRFSADGQLLSRVETPNGYALDDLMRGKDGSIYVTGTGDVDPDNRWTNDTFVAKLTPDGRFEWLQPLADFMSGGQKGAALSSDGFIYVAGPPPEDYFGGISLVRVPVDGGAPSQVSALIGSGSPSDVAIAPDGSVVVVGSVRDGGLPVVGGFSGPTGRVDAYVARFSPTTGTQTYGTYLGGGSIDGANAVAVDPDGATYLTGSTDSSDFYSRRPAGSRLPAPTEAGFQDVFVAKIAPGGDLEYSTALPGWAAEAGYDIAVTDDGSAVVTGSQVGEKFPQVGSDLSAGNDRGELDLFIVRVAPRGASLSVATSFGGSGQDGVSSVLVENDGDLLIGGASNSPDLPSLIGPRAAQVQGAGMLAAFAYTPEVVDPVVKAKRVQAQGGRRTVSVRLQVSAAEAVTTKIAGKVKSAVGARRTAVVKREVPFAESRRVRLRLSPRASRTVLKQLRNGGSAKASVRVRFRDGDGDTKTKIARVKLR